MTDAVPTSLYVVTQLGEEVQNWLVKVILYLPKILWGATIMAITILVANQLSKLAKKLLSKTKIEKTFIQIICLVIRWIILLTGALFTLSALGLKGIVASVVAGAGFTSVVIAFGTQDISKNLIAGVFIIVGRQFKIGDNIVVKGGHEGIVRKITLRSIVLESTDGKLISVPNNTIFSNIVTNMTSKGKRRVYIDLKIKTNVDFDQFEKTIQETLLKDSTVFKKPTPEILLKNIDSKYLEVQISYWSDSSPMKQRRSVSSINQKLLKVLRENNWLLD